MNQQYSMQYQPVMKSNYYPKFNLLLVDGREIFNTAFTCFLDIMYQLSSFKKNDDGDMYLHACDNTKKILSTCLLSTEEYIKIIKLHMKQNKLFCNIILYFNLQDLEQTQEIFKYIDKSVVFAQINKVLKTFKRKKVQYYIYNLAEKINFTENYKVINTPAGKVQEVLNIINFKLS